MAIDPDIGDSHTFELAAGTGDTDNGSFLIAGGDLFFRQGETADYELQGDFEIRVAAIDALGERFEKPMSVDVLNLPEYVAIRFDENEIGNEQRSILRSVTVIFDTIVQADETSFDLVKLGISDPVAAAVGFTVNLVEVDGHTEAILNFNGQHLDVGGVSLADGRYQLNILGDAVSDSLGRFLDGDQDGIDGGDVVIGDDSADGFFRWFGDKNGDGVVSGLDLAEFGRSFLRSDPDVDYDLAFDADGDLDVDAIDQLEFMNRLWRRLSD